MPTDDLVGFFAAMYHERPDGSLRVAVNIDGRRFSFSPEQAEELEAMLHRETQKAVEQVAREVDRFA